MAPYTPSSQMIMYRLGMEISHESKDEAIKAAANKLSSAVNIGTLVNGGRLTNDERTALISNLRLWETHLQYLNNEYAQRDRAMPNSPERSVTVLDRALAKVFGSLSSQEMTALQDYTALAEGYIANGPLMEEMAAEFEPLVLDALANLEGHH